MREHQPGFYGEKNLKRCIHCGSAWSENMGISCIERKGTSSKLRPEPFRRVWASEAYEAIGARLADLERERKAILAAPAPPEDT